MIDNQARRAEAGEDVGDVRITAFDLIARLITETKVSLSDCTIAAQQL